MDDVNALTAKDRLAFVETHADWVRPRRLQLAFLARPGRPGPPTLRESAALFLVSQCYFLCSEYFCNLQGVALCCIIRGEQNSIKIDEIKPVDLIIKFNYLVFWFDIK